MNEKKTVKQKKTKPYQTGNPIVHHFNEIDLSGTYSYANYLNWKFEERLELIRGKIFEMSAPLTFHQEVSREVAAELYIHLKGKKCSVFSAPFDVRFPKGSKDDKNIYTVVQPDICVICDLQKLDRKGCIGPPNIVVEILSPSNNQKDLQIKYELYQEFGVKEYWIVDPNTKTFLKHVLNDSGNYVTAPPFIVGDKFTSDILPGFSLNLDEIFQTEVPVLPESVPVTVE
ncbi:Uma2 family endonuclease [Pedobacter hiemivivus]|uniref:Uma2 family endonuclease n=1 Tax=Pedobacter hiemivivus TaxID=2530454 RepID=A0A4U1G5R2_9SPHI|nr:Uma2 family endonuclease [Pedobacter hiemivivus]TKC59091.1 Uma2 family endonuclease [Pedobacter hiemivivus]